MAKVKTDGYTWDLVFNPAKIKELQKFVWKLFHEQKSAALILLQICHHGQAFMNYNLKKTHLSGCWSLGLDKWF